MNPGGYVVVGAIVGFLGAILAAWLNNRENSKRLEKQLLHDTQRQERQLAHDAEERRLERERSLQREIYLGVVEAGAKWQEFLAGFADPSLSQQDHRQILQGAGQQVSKAYVIGKITTLNEVDKLNVYFSENALFLAELRLEANLAAEQVTRLEGQLRVSQERGAQIISAAQIAQQSGDKVIASLLSSFEENQGDVERLQELLSQAVREQGRLMLTLVTEASRIANEFAVLSIKGLISARRELGIDTSEDFEKRLQESAEEAARRVRSNVNEWVEKVSKKYGASG